MCFGRMRGFVRIFVQRLLQAFLVCLAGPMAAIAADWQAVEQTNPYKIAGTTGAELYASIGERGPIVGGKVRTIAHTTFTLKWSRKYVPEGGACRLASAKPSLIITYTLPEPAKKLSGAAARHWDVFIDGIRRHEQVHGQQIREMVDTILATTVGLSVPDDPKCQKIRKEITKPLSAASMTQRQRARDFDRDELGNGGNVHNLILALVNGR